MAVESGYSGLLTNVVRVGTEEGTTDAYTHTATVDAPIGGLEALNDSPSLLGDPTTLTATITAGTNVTFTWALGDGATGTGAVVTHTYPSTGTYAAVVTASNSVSTVTATTVVVVDETITGVAAFNDSPMALGDPTTLAATVAAGSNVTFTWAFGVGWYGGGAVVSHTYPVVGIYTAVVTASNSVSVMTAAIEITVTRPMYHIDLPLVEKGWNHRHIGREGFAETEPNDGRVGADGLLHRGSCLNR